MEKQIKETQMWHALLIVGVLIGLLVWGIVFNGLDPHALLFTAAMFAAAIGVFVLNHKWEDMQESIFESIKSGMIAILILITVGALIGTWIQSGVVPSMIYYGLQIINPQYFLVSALLMSSIAALGTGSSWSTCATVGVALMGIAEGLGFPSAMTAGAIISGAWFGDKLSPLSDTSNLSCAAVKTDLIAHIKHMQYTSVPAYLITIVLFTVLGFQASNTSGADASSVAEIMDSIKGGYNISPALLLVPVFVITMIFKGVPAIPGLFIGGLVGGFVAVLAQGVSVADFVNVMLNGYESSTGHDFVDTLLSRGGMDGMMWTNLLIINALMLGGILDKIGVISLITAKILSAARSVGDLTLAVVASCLFVNAAAADQYLALIIPGNMYAQAYRDRGLHPKNLTRTLQDTGAVTSPLIPWNTCGAFMMGALGVEPWVYVPFAFFNLLSPLMSIIFAYMGWTMTPYDPEEDKIFLQAQAAKEAMAQKS